jgi:hypothetical protein
MGSTACLRHARVFDIDYCCFTFALLLLTAALLLLYCCFTAALLQMSWTTCWRRERKCLLLLTTAALLLLYCCCTADELDRMLETRAQVFAEEDFEATGGTYVQAQFTHPRLKACVC